MRLKKYLANTPNLPLVIELFTKPVPFDREVHYDKIVYIFTITGKDGVDKQYQAQIWKDDDLRWGEKSWEVIFELVWLGQEKIFSFGREAITGSGDAIAVFSTMGSILKDFVKTQKVDVIRFSAKEPSRIKLYKTLSKHIASKSPFKATTILKKTSNTIFINARDPERIKEIKDNWS